MGNRGTGPRPATWFLGPHKSAAKGHLNRFMLSVKSATTHGSSGDESFAEERRRLVEGDLLAAVVRYGAACAEEQLVLEPDLLGFGAGVPQVDVNGQSESAVASLRHLVRRIFHHCNAMPNKPINQSSRSQWPRGQRVRLRCKMTQVRISQRTEMFITTATAICSLGHGLRTSTAVLKSFQPCIPPGL